MNLNYILYKYLGLEKGIVNRLMLQLYVVTVSKRT